jgi:KUP system potassium uptake protein
MTQEGTRLNDKNPFYHLMPDWFLYYGIGVATLAAIIASQALISGSFTLIAEAVRLNLWPKVRINYPTIQRGQLYVPSMNLILWLGCITVIFLFRRSTYMEAAYGLSITIAMLMTTILVSIYLRRKKVPGYLVVLFLLTYGLIELTFFIGNLAKIFHGGWFALTVGCVLFFIMWSWSKGRKIKNKYVRFVDLENYYSIIRELSSDISVPKYATQLVYLTSAEFSSELESTIIYSILQKQPKRADVYWLVHVDVLDQPYGRHYKVIPLISGKLIRIDFKLGFRIEQRISHLFRLVVQELVKSKEVDIISQYQSLRKHHIIGDFRFVVLQKVLSRSNTLSIMERFIVACYNTLKHFSLSEEKGFGLDLSFVTVEKVPLIVSKTEEVNLIRL